MTITAKKPRVDWECEHCGMNGAADSVGSVPSECDGCNLIAFFYTSVAPYPPANGVTRQAAHRMISNFSSHKDTWGLLLALMRRVRILEAP